MQKAEKIKSDTTWNQLLMDKVHTYIWESRLKKFKNRNASLCELNALIDLIANNK